MRKLTKIVKVNTITYKSLIKSGGGKGPMKPSNLQTHVV